MGVGKDWNSKNRVHTQFFTLTNPESGVPQFCETKPSSLPPVLSLLFFVTLKEIFPLVKTLTIGIYPHTNISAWGFTFYLNNTII